MRILLLIPLVFFIVLMGKGEKKNKTVQAEGHPANQHYCIGSVYKETTDNCEKVSFSTPQVEVVTKEEPPPKMKVVYVATAKKRDGCVTLTKGSPFPLDVEKCRLLALLHKRVDPSKTSDIVIEVGEKWFLTNETVDGLSVYEWKIEDGKY